MRGKTGTAILFLIFLLLESPAFPEELDLGELILEAIKISPDLLASQSRIEGAQYRIPQSRSLSDPMLMFGYQNEGWKRYTYGEMEGAQWMFSLSQTFPYPGKRDLKGKMAEKDAESLEAQHEFLLLRTVLKVKELYFDLFFAYKGMDILQDKRGLLSQIEELAAARYGSGKGMQEEVLMAQTEKYMLLEKEAMLRQKISSIEAMLCAAIGRSSVSPLGRPVEPGFQALPQDPEEVIRIAHAHSPEIKVKEKMIEAAFFKLRMAEKEYYPDFTISASYFKRSGDFLDMWSTTAAMNIPLFVKTKQDMAVREAKASLAEAEQELNALKLMISAAIRDNYAMITASEKIMELYKEALIPKGRQDFELALLRYRTQTSEAPAVVSKLKSLLDYDLLYWGQFVEREKAIARLQAITGDRGLRPGGGQ